MSTLWEKPCPFCPIIEGDAPATIVERGARHIAFIPLGPHVPGHVMFVPTEHLPDATVNPARTGEVVAEASRYVAQRGIAANIITSVGVAATQSVPHLHVHVVPRGAGDGLAPRWPWLNGDAHVAAERERADAAEAKIAAVEALADWHEMKADKARRFRPEVNGENRVMDKAASVHDDAAHRLRAALADTGEPT